MNESHAIVAAEDLPKVRGEESQLTQVFQNLLSNALKYRNQTEPPQIQISAQQHDDHWTISVQDNGIGFEPQYAERIFGLFKRLHKDEYPVTGLGLAICLRVIERYGGECGRKANWGRVLVSTSIRPAQKPPKGEPSTSRPLRLLSAASCRSAWSQYSCQSGQSNSR